MHSVFCCCLFVLFYSFVCLLVYFILLKKNFLFVQIKYWVIGRDAFLQRHGYLDILRCYNES